MQDSSLWTLLIYSLNPACPLKAMFNAFCSTHRSNVHVIFGGFNWNVNGSWEPCGDGRRCSWTNASAGENRLRAVAKATETFKWNLGSLFYAAIWWITFSWAVTGPAKVFRCLASPNGSRLHGGINDRHTSRGLYLLSLLGRVPPNGT